MLNPAVRIGAIAIVLGGGILKRVRVGLLWGPIVLGAGKYVALEALDIPQYVWASRSTGFHKLEVAVALQTFGYTIPRWPKQLPSFLNILRKLMCKAGRQLLTRLLSASLVVDTLFSTIHPQTFACR